VFGPQLRPGENAKLGAFAQAAIVGEPLTYLEYVARGLVRVVDPSFSASPYPAVGSAGAGYSPAANVNWYFLPETTRGAERIVTSYYNGSKLHAGNTSLLRAWERATRLQGPAMAVALLLAIVSPFLARGLCRRLAVLVALTSAVLIVGPILVVDYDYRYVIPAFGPLTAAAAIGAYGVVRLLTPLWFRRRLATAGGVAQSAEQTPTTRSDR
jgi:hypothetical protein